MILSPTKEKQRKKIIDIAKNLIMESGISDTTVTQIAHAAKIDRKTFYNYFSDIETLVETIMEETDALKQLGFEIEMDSSGMNGWLQLEHFLLMFFDKVLMRRQLMLMTYHYDYKYSQQPYFMGSKNLEELVNSYIYKIVQLGAEDGSINTYGMPLHRFIISIIVPLFSGMQKFFMREDIFNELYDTNAEDLKTSILIVLNGIKNNNVEK